MEKTVKVTCLNNGQDYDIPMGSNLSEALQLMNLTMEHEPILAHVNNKVEGMHYRIYKPKRVEFLDITSASGQRAYTRTLFFILCKAVRDLYTPCKVAIDIPVSNGYYVDLNIGHPVTLEDAGRIRKRMQEIIDAAMPIHRHETVRSTPPSTTSANTTTISMVPSSPIRNRSISSDWRNTMTDCCCASLRASTPTSWARL